MEASRKDGLGGDWARNPQRWPLDSHDSHLLVFVPVLRTHHNGGLKNLLKMLSGVMEKNFTKKPRDKSGLLAWAGGRWGLGESLLLLCGRLLLQ